MFFKIWIMDKNNVFTGNNCSENVELQNVKIKYRNINLIFGLFNELIKVFF